MVSCNLGSQVHDSGQAQMPIPVRSVPAEQCNLFSDSGSRGKSTSFNESDFCYTQLLPWVSQVSFRYVVPGVVAL